MTGPVPSTYEPFPAFTEWADLAVDIDTVDRFAAVLTGLRDGTDPDRLARAVTTATRLAAIDTGAIEGLYDVDRGFTLSVAVKTAAWEALIDAREPIVRRSFEDALRAYDYVLDLATTKTEISEKAIREIHAQICASQKTYRVVTSAGVQERPLSKGGYKETPNNPTSRLTGQVHAYAPPIDVPAEMHRLVGELRSEAFTAAHPVLQAAYAHYAFVAIHPFADGNGRVARTLASVYLYRWPGVPLVTLADDKDDYIDALEEADDGRPERLVRFVQDRLVDVIGLVQVATSAEAPEAGASIASLRETFLTEEGVTLAELDAVGGRLGERVVAEIEEQLTALDLPPGIQWRSEWGPTGWVLDESVYRDLLARRWRVDLTGHGARASQLLAVGVRKPGSDAPQFRVATVSDLVLPVELREVYPRFGAMFTIKLRTWVDALVRDLLARFDGSARENLRSAER